MGFMELTAVMLGLAVQQTEPGWEPGPALSPMAAGSKTGLRDAPLATSTLQYLDSSDGVQWVAAPSGSDIESAASIPADVPGDLISDLYAAGRIGNPLYELNFQNNTLWQQDWTYTTTISPKPRSSGTTLLVFDGVKMGADIYFGGTKLGTVTDQFLRYYFDVSTLLQSGKTDIALKFKSSIPCDARWMGCTGGWDWAPYSGTMQEGAATFSKGVWKSVYLASMAPSEAAILHAIPLVFYQGGYVASPLTDETKSDFEVRTTVHIYAPVATTVYVTLQGSWDTQVTTSVDVHAGESNITVSLAAAASDILLWWPAGSGAQHLYNVTVGLGHSAATQPYVTTTRSVGFRTLALVTGNDTDPSYVATAESEEGTERHGMLFRINGAAIFTRGANVIPMDELEGWWDTSAHKILVESALQGHFTMLRVWGGGAWLPDAFYSECDRLGLLIYHDVMFAQNGHAPQATPTQEAELRHQIRRIGHHTSLALIDGCNECTVVMTNPATAIYATFVMRVVASEDPSRPIWPSCPATGWSAGVHKLNSTANGNPLSTPDTTSKRCTEIPGAHCIEAHRPKWLGSGFAAMNGNPSLTPSHGDTPFPNVLYSGMFPPSIPLELTPTAVGPEYRNNFSSESPGNSVMSSFESMSPTLKQGKLWKSLSSCCANAWLNCHIELVLVRSFANFNWTWPTPQNTGVSTGESLSRLRVQRRKGAPMQTRCRSETIRVTPRSWSTLGTRPAISTRLERQPSNVSCTTACCLKHSL
eukprot:m.334008 g.334008  ORF g.334008 m.334008 type:complete len:757 (-) comp27747_c0_seq3:1006-3276(-)